MKSKSPNLKVIAAGAAVALLGSVLGYLTLIAPQRSEASKLADEITATELQIAQARAKSRAPITPARVDEIFRFSKAIPNDEDMPGIMLELSRIAGETGITFDSIKPAPTDAGTTTSRSIELIFEGNFYELSDFLFRLRSLVAVRDGRYQVDGRLFTVDTLDFAPGQEKPLKATLTASAFIYPGAAPAAPPPAEHAAAGGTG
jgi:Tfp pilus assembly protein PilO